MRGVTPLRLVVGVGVLIIVGAFILDMSGSARRLADTDHVSTPVFAANVPGGGTACQPLGGVPNDVAGIQLLIGTFGQPVPSLGFSFLGRDGKLLAVGNLRGGAHEGQVVIPLTRAGNLSAATQGCLHVSGTHEVVLGGEAGPGGAEVVNGKRQPGNIGLTYLRPGSESWWHLLPTLDTRFGLGKASFFGDWTLPVMAVLLLGVWIAAIRLILRERA